MQMHRISVAQIHLCLNECHNANDYIEVHLSIKLSKKFRLCCFIFTSEERVTEEFC